MDCIYYPIIGFAMDEEGKTYAELLEEVKGLRKEVAGYKERVAADRTELKRLDPEVLASLMDDVNDSLLVIDPEDGRFITANKRACECLGYEMEELLQLGVSDVCESLEGGLPCMEHMERVRAQGALRSKGVCRRKDETLFPVGVSIRLIKDHEGEYLLAVVKDISEIRRVEELLSLQGEMIDRMAEGAVLVRTSSGEVLYANPKMEEFFGYDRGEMVGMDVGKLNSPSEDGRTPEEVRDEVIGEILREGSWRGVLKQRRKDGTTFWGSTVVNQYKSDKSGEVSLGLMTDVTEKKIAEEKIASSETELARAQEVAKLGSWSHELPENRLTWSKERYRIFGIPEGTPISYEKFLDAVHPEDRNYVDSEWKAAIKGKPYDIEHRLLVDDKVKWIRESAELVFDEEGTPLRGVGIAQEITDRKEIELALRKSEQLFQTLTRISPVGIFHADKDGDCLYVNERWSEIGGISAEEALGSGWVGALHPDDRETVFNKWKECIEERRPFRMEYRYRQPGGRVIWVLGEVQEEVDKCGEVVGYVGTITDLTTQKEVEEALIRARVDAESANMAKGTFLATMSHEIRTPMNAIIGISELLERTVLSKEQREDVAVIREAGERLLSLLSDILDISKIEAGEMEFELGSFNPGSTVEAVSSMLSRKAAEKGLTINTEIDGALSVTLLGDENRLSQVLINLVSNAIKFTEEGQVNIACKVEDEVDDKVIVLFTVQDTGIGIDEDKVIKVFELFTQADSSTTREFGGTGLGLNIAKMLVEHMGGELRVESKVGEGSTFTFTVAFKKATDTLSDEEVSLGDTHDHNLNVLVAEDDKINQIVVSRMLKKLGCNVEIASNGAEAVGKAFDKEYDTIFMDVSMPELNGYQATERIRQSESYVGKHTPIIALTAMVFSEDRVRCFEAGMDDYLVKPVTIKSLSDMLGRYTEAA